MHGFVSLLDEKYSGRIEKLWDLIETKTGLSGIKIVPYPHFAWHVAGNYDFNKLEKIMKDLSESIPSFEIRTAGLGIFAGRSPVLYLKIVNTIELLKIHSKIYQNAQTIAEYSNTLYAPNNWVPHISLALGDLTKENIGAVIKLVAFKSFYWKIRINNLSFIYGPAGEIGKLKFKFLLKE